MKRNSLLFATALLIGLTGCKNTPAPQEAWMSNALDAASYQLKLTAEELSGTGKLPRSIYSGYDVNFLDTQLQREDKSYIDCIPIHRLCNWAKDIFAAFTTGPAVSFPAAFGMLTK